MQGKIEFRVGGAGRTTQPPVLLNANAPRLVVERRAADVLVLGDSALASAACASLARRGKKVIHLPDMGLLAPEAPVQEALKPLILPDTNLQLASMSNEAARFFQGLEMQVSSKLVLRCRSVDVATTRSGLREQQGVVGAMQSLMTTLAETSQAAGFRVGQVLATDLPLLRLTDNMSGLVQADGGVVNAMAVAAALQTLAKRAGVLQRDNLVLRGWQDTGSCLRVRASSRLQPDALSVFEAEQVLLAPGSWAPDCLSMWGLQLDLQLRARPALRCTSSPDLTNLPLVRHWRTPDSQPPPTNTDQGSRQSPSRAPDTGKGQVAAASTSPPQPRVDSHWVLFPRSGSSGTCKLTGTSPGQSLMATCWQLPVSSAASAAGAPGGSSEQVMAAEWQQAEQLVRGLGRPLGAPQTDAESEADGKDGDEAVAGARTTVQTAWDTVTPDGLPVLGWHPGFESGRVLVACTAGSHPNVPVSTSNKAGGDAGSVSGSQQTPSGPHGDQRDGRAERLTGRQAEQAADRARQQAEQAAKKITRTAGEQEQQRPVVGALHDGWHLTPLLAKTAADMLMSAPLLDLPLDIGSLAVSRVALAGSKVEGQQALDTWDGLEQLQTGELYRRRVVSLMSEEERQEREEAMHAQGQAVASR